MIARKKYKRNLTKNNEEIPSCTKEKFLLASIVEESAARENSNTWDQISPGNLIDFFIVKL